MTLETRIAQGRGDEPADLVLKGGVVWDMVTGAKIPGDVAICGDRIVGIGADYAGKREVDVTGKLLVPGFIDTHLHIESSCITPYEFDRCVLPRGVTTAICDPHEIANVCGLTGIRYFLEASARTVMDIRVNLSSCVPSTHMETAGARLEAEDLLPLADHPRVIGLAEFMNYPGVIHAEMVFCGGVLASDEAFAAREIIEPVARGSVHVPPLSAESFRYASNNPETPVIGIWPGKILTEHLRLTVPATDGDKRPDPAQDLARITVIERHGKNGNIANGFVRGFALKRGAIASTVCHDHHNIAVVGVDYADMKLAAERLGQIEGGFVVVEGGKVLAELALPVAGLMSLDPFEHVRDRLVDLRQAARSLGVELEEPFLQLAFVALPVIPHLKITDFGLVDVDRFEVIG